MHALLGGPSSRRPSTAHACACGGCASLAEGQCAALRCAATGRAVMLKCRRPITTDRPNRDRLYLLYIFIPTCLRDNGFSFSVRRSIARAPATVGSSGDCETACQEIKAIDRLKHASAARRGVMRLCACVGSDRIGSDCIDRLSQRCGRDRLERFTRTVCLCAKRPFRWTAPAQSTVGADTMDGLRKPIYPKPYCEPSLRRACIGAQQRFTQ